MKAFIRSKLILVFVTLAMIMAAIIIPLSGSLFPSHAASLAVGPQPIWGLPFPQGTHVGFGDLGLHDKNFSSIPGFSFTNPREDGISLDLGFPQITNGIASISTTPLASGQVLAVWPVCHLILIDHNHGWWAIYLHLDQIQVVKGEKVSVNTPLGKATTDINSDSPCFETKSDPSFAHLHFALVNDTGTKDAFGRRVGTYISLKDKVLCGHRVQSNGLLANLMKNFTIPKCPGPAPVAFSGHAASAFATLAGTFFSNSNFIACDTGHVTKHGNSKLPVGANEPINFFGLGNGGGSLQFHMLAAPGPGACFSSSVSKLTGDHTGKVTSISSLNGPIATSTFLLGAALELFAIGGDATSQSSAFCKQEGLAHSSAASSVTGFFPSTAHPFGFYLSGTPLSTHEITGQANQPIFGLPAGYSGFLNEIFASASGDTASATAIAVEIDGPGFQEFIGISHADITCA